MRSWRFQGVSQLPQEARAAPDPECFRPSGPSPVFLLWDMCYLHNLVSNLQPSNFSRASFRYSCDINALERNSPGQAPVSLDWHLIQRAKPSMANSQPSN